MADVHDRAAVALYAGKVYRKEETMDNKITVPDVCPKCNKPVRIDPHRPGDAPNRWVHSATGREGC